MDAIDPMMYVEHSYPCANCICYQCLNHEHCFICLLSKGAHMYDKEYLCYGYSSCPFDNVE